MEQKLYDAAKTCAPVQQHRADVFEARVRMADNGFTVKTAKGYYVFKDWEEVVGHLGRHFHGLQKEAARRG